MEENLKLVEELIKEYKLYGDLDGIAINDMSLYINAIEHLIKGYKELEEENKELLELRICASAHNRIMELEKENQSYRDYYGTPPCYDNSKYIPVSLVEEKIEELDKEYKDILSDYGNIDTDVVINIPNENVRKYCDKLVEKIIVLQKLLEKRK